MSSKPGTDFVGSRWSCMLAKLSCVACLGGKPKASDMDTGEDEDGEDDDGFIPNAEAIRYGDSRLTCLVKGGGDSTAEPFFARQWTFWLGFFRVVGVSQAL
eukprot:scaffold426040_cov33-Prasinocladus_malaysianus.AAC.1